MAVLSISITCVSSCRVPAVGHLEFQCRNLVVLKPGGAEDKAKKSSKPLEMVASDDEDEEEEVIKRAD